MDKYYKIDEKFIGIPYELGGVSFKGTDCIGISIIWLKEHGIDIEYEDGHGVIQKDWFDKNPKRFIDGVLKHGDIVGFSDLKKFDCLLLAGTNQGIVPACMAIMIDDRHILTSQPERGSFVEMLNMYWKSLFWGGLRLHKIKQAGF